MYRKTLPTQIGRQRIVMLFLFFMVYTVLLMLIFIVWHETPGPHLLAAASYSRVIVGS